MKLPPFEFTRADSTPHAMELLGQHGSEAKLLAGGQSLLPLMNLGLATPSHLIDIARLKELEFIRTDGEELVIGATTRHARLEATRLGPQWRAFSDAALMIGHYPIRTRGTFGGSVAHADATAELPLIAQTLEAVIVAESLEGRREIPAESFFQGVFTTDLKPTELIIEVRVPKPPDGAVSAFEEFSERAGDFAVASVCVAVARDDSGRCSWARVGLGAVAPRPIRSPSVEAALVGSPLDSSTIEAATTVALRDCEPRGGLHVSPEYRGELIIEMLRRSLRRLISPN